MLKHRCEKVHYVQDTQMLLPRSESRSSSLDSQVKVKNDYLITCRHCGYVYSTWDYIAARMCTSESRYLVDGIQDEVDKGTGQLLAFRSIGGLVELVGLRVKVPLKRTVHQL